MYPMQVEFWGCGVGTKRCLQLYDRVLGTITPDLVHIGEEDSAEQGV